MQVKDLSRLVEVWRLVEKDPGTKEIQLSRDGARILGMHVEASRKIPKNMLPMALKARISIDGALLAGTLALMSPGAAIVAKQTESSLILTAGGRRAVLRMRGDASAGASLDFKAKPFDSTKLRDELPFLRGCVAGGVIAPILTGIHFRATATGMRPILEATDKTRRSGQVALSLPCSVSGQVVPAADLEAALSLLDTRISMKFSKGHLHLRDKTTAIKISLLQGTYPDLSRLPHASKYKHELILKRTQIETAIQAAVLLDSDRLLRLTIKDKKAALLVQGQETGGFRQPAGPCDLPDIEIVFDAHWLDAATHLGDRVKLRYNNERSPVLFSGNKRLLWMSPVVRA